MLKTTESLIAELRDYSNPQCKIGRMVRDGELFPIRRGLYETEKDVPEEFLAGEICSPSYISFEYALAYHGIIPESVVTVTSATFGKHKDKVFKNTFGRYTYTDIPQEVFPMYVSLGQWKKWNFWMATKEKAVCDLIYKEYPMKNMDDFTGMIFEDLRFNEEIINGLDQDIVSRLAEGYHCRNVDLLNRYLAKL